MTDLPTNKAMTEIKFFTELSVSELRLRVSLLNICSKIVKSTITSPYKCPSLMHIVLCSLIVAVRPIQMSHSHAGVPRTTT